MRNCRLGRCRAALLASLMVAVMAVPATAQMVTGERMRNYGPVFDVKLGERSYPFSVVQVESSVPGQILFPGEQPTWTLQIQSNVDQPITGRGTVEVIQYGTRGQPGDIWEPDLYRIGVAASVPVEVNLPGKGTQNITVSPKLPETFGGYGVVVELPGQGRRFAFSAARTFKPTPKKIQYPSLSLDAMPVEMLQRLGVQAVRLELGWIKPEHTQYAAKMAELDRQLKSYQANNITVMMMIDGSPTIAQPMGRGRPHLDAEDNMLQTKEDIVWLPSEDAAFEKWVENAAATYGWPKGPVTAISLWNEPWEGISISGWGADMLRYRELFRRMGAGVMQARKEAGVEVLLAGCDSSSNTLDKLFPDGSDEFLQLLDVCTIHYQGMSGPSTYKRWINRQSPMGRVRIWDTESWVANTDDRVAAVVAGNKSAGYDRAMGVFSGNIGGQGTSEVMVDGVKQRLKQPSVWSTAASVGAGVHFIGERPFQQLLFKNGLPWVMVFDGLPDDAGKVNADDGTVVIVGDLGDTFGKDGLLFRTIDGLAQIPQRAAVQQQLAALASDESTKQQRKALEKKLAGLAMIGGASLTLADGGGKFTLCDFYGNPQPSAGGRIVMPLDGRGFFLRTDGSAGSFEKLKAAVGSARIEGLEPLEMVPHDFYAAIESKPSLRVTCTNILNRPISGRLSATLGELKVELPPALSFAAHETRDVEIKVVDGKSLAANTYPLKLRFEAKADGFSEHAEDVHVNVIAQRAITVDGKLDEWKGVLPQTVTSDGSAVPSLAEAAWFPFVKYNTTVKKGLASGYLAYDEQNFYFAAKVADDTPHPGTMRFETRNDDVFFYPDVAYEMDAKLTVATKRGEITKEERRPFALLKPGEPKSGQRSNETLESVAKTIGVHLSLPEKLTQVSFYFLDDDTGTSLGRRDAQIELTDAAGNALRLLDAQTGKRSAKTTLREFGRGTYATYCLSGEVNVTIRGIGPRSAVVAGVFIDEAPKGMAEASFMGLDVTTEGNWIGTYGKLGHYVVGTPEKYPAGVKVEFVQHLEKNALPWPEEVRHFSYRKRPISPSGTAPNFDNIQIAFNAIPLEEDPVMIANPPGTMPKYIGYRCTDYEFALNKVADEFGGGTEIWRLEVPQQERKNFYPRQPKSPWEGAVKDGKLAIVQEGGTRVVEASIPWKEIPHVKALLDAGKPVKFSFRVNDDAGVGCLELARGRAVSRRNDLAFHCDWMVHWANEVEFVFQKNEPRP